MAAKYIPASLLTTLRIFDTFTPRCNDLKDCTRTMTTTKTAMSIGGRVVQFKGWNGEIRGSGGILTEGEREGYQSDRRVSPGVGSTELI